MKRRARVFARGIRGSFQPRELKRWGGKNVSDWGKNESLIAQGRSIASTIEEGGEGKDEKIT